MKFNYTSVFNFENAIRGVRNPMNSWNKSDSGYAVKEYELHDGEEKVTYDESQFGIGSKDIELMQKLIKGGPEHRKFMRQIMVSVDITAPLYWWKEFDTYKVGTTANSTSTMHKLATTPITWDCFELNDYSYESSILPVYDNEPYNIDTSVNDMWEEIIGYCETLRKRYLETKDMKYWKELIRILPEGWLQTRTVTMNYENLYSIVRQRKGHKLTEWESFINWVQMLPFADELIFIQ